MTTARHDPPSITGRPAVHLIFREVWADQVDNYGDACPVCQLEGRTIECNVYVPVIYERDGVMLSACRCCAPAAVLDHHALDTDHDAVIEYAKEK
jgi:hypothetical protein